jgi:hypothetical protein
VRGNLHRAVIHIEFSRGREIVVKGQDRRLLMGADLFPEWIADVIVVEREEKAAVSVADLNPG